MIARRARMARVKEGREMVRVDRRPGLGLPRLSQLRSPPIRLILIPKLLETLLHVRIRLCRRARDSERDDGGDEMRDRRMKSDCQRSENFKEQRKGAGGSH
jgi:hypothetical protein